MPPRTVNPTAKSESRKSNNTVEPQKVQSSSVSAGNDGGDAGLDAGESERNVLNLDELKSKTINELTEIARSLSVMSPSALRKQELIFKILEAQTEKDGFIYGERVGKAPDAQPSPQLTGHHPDYVGSLIDAYAR